MLAASAITSYQCQRGYPQHAPDLLRLLRQRDPQRIARCYRRHGIIGSVHASSSQSSRQLIDPACFRLLASCKGIDGNFGPAFREPASDGHRMSAAASEASPQEFSVSACEDSESVDGLEVAKLPENERLRLREQFDLYDKDGNGVIDKTELRNLLEDIAGQDSPSTAQHWVVDSIVDSVMASFDSDGSDDLDFADFARLMEDTVLLDGKLREYQQAFQAIDTSGNGLLAASEVKALFEDLGHSLTDQKLFDIMEKCDAGGQGQLAFNDFLGLFREELLEAQEVVAYISMRPSDSAPLPRGSSIIEWSPGEPMLIFSSQEMDELMQAHPERVVVLEASFTWCRPCKAFQKPYERFAEAYPDTIFLKFFGNSNENTKALFQDRLDTPTTPHFTFWRDGKKLGQHSGANKGKMLKGLNTHLSEWDNPIAGASKFKQQVWSARLLGPGSAP